MTLKKLAIVAYSDPGFTQSVGSYSVQVNPETYRQTHATQFTKNDSTDAAGVTTKFYVQDPQNLSFEFYLDATGALQPAIASVADEINKFKTVAYAYNGAIHGPNYLQIVWGSGAQFNCRLTSLDIDYMLFRSDGTPIRAKLSVGFEQYLSPQQIEQAANKSSPDLTHQRSVVAGDTLPSMCERIYGDSKYYIGVAAYNGLHNFRSLRPGTTLIFPPLEQSWRLSLPWQARPTWSALRCWPMAAPCPARMRCRCCGCISRSTASPAPASSSMTAA